MNNPIRVLHMIASLNLGGSQAMVMNLYRNIDRSKVQFDFIIDHPNATYYQEEIEKLGGKVFLMPTFKMINVLEVRKAWDIFFIEHTEYKVLHSHSRSYASVYLPIAKKHGVKTIIHSHSTSNGRGIDALIKGAMQIPLRFQADYFMACSSQAGRWLFGKRVVDDKRCMIIKNAIDVKNFSFCESKREAARKEFGIDQKAFVVGFLGRVTEAKNPLYALDVFAGVLEKERNSILLFVGDGEKLEEVKRYAYELGIDRCVIFTGARDDTNYLYCAMDAYLFPSRWEGLGISLVEAQASGLRCYCSENVPNEAIITDLVKKIFIAEDPQVWAKELLDNREADRRNNLYKKIQEAGFDIKENAKWVQDFYLSLAR